MIALAAVFMAAILSGATAIDLSRSLRAASATTQAQLGTTRSNRNGRAVSFLITIS